ncbi:hypothetical protein FK178_04850 [Antarcticibacterium arcticum]|uniref:Uncharacterized protein n=1 Tax=Antarcticibacterium arcticum TaxID=2585771 RepID=A0A5B8YJ32_9FLAO|nr:hypothetical protein [Antarcticibacterium arcticum]QED37078.1 hypothetical protein FK178_04850 [Antarcticibacterium arcticum]
MKNLLYALGFILAGSLYGQDTLISKVEQNTTLETNQVATDQFILREATLFTFNNEELHFTPGENEILITRNQNGKETPYATLRQTTDDGFFIMTSPISDDVSYGRFDKDGNFRTFRYNSEQDEFIEEVYTIGKPVSSGSQIGLKINKQ